MENLNKEGTIARKKEVVKPTEEWKEVSSGNRLSEKMSNCRGEKDSSSKSSHQENFGYFFSDDESEGGKGGDTTIGVNDTDKSLKKSNTSKKSKIDIGKEKAKEQELKNDLWFKSVNLKTVVDGDANINTNSEETASSGTKKNGQANNLTNDEEKKDDEVGDGIDTNGSIEVEGYSAMESGVISKQLKNDHAKSNVGSDVAGKQQQEKGTSMMPSAQEMMLNLLKGNQSKAKKVLMLNMVTGDDSEVFPSNMQGSTHNTLHVPVHRKLDESFYHALAKSVNVTVSPETLVVCQVQSISEMGEGGIETKDLISQLGSFFAPFVSESGLLFYWQQYDDFSVTPTDIILELAGAGLIPAASGGNHFNPKVGFAAYFQKESFSIRCPRDDDLDRLCAIDEESWNKELRYSGEIIKKWVSNKPQGIILIVDNISGDVVGAMYTQRVKDGEMVDSKPWRESITESAGIEGHSVNQNIDLEGMTKQLMRVSTQKGGGEVTKYVPGTALRDFALVIAASQGIDQVVSM